MILPPAIRPRALLAAGRRRAFRSQALAAALARRLTTTRSPSELEALGASVAKRRRPGDVLFLRGDLGCGKTCFARGFVRAHVGDEALAVTSPTYLLVNTYEAPAPVFHVDLYRLDAVSEQDVAALGLADAFTSGITLVEWPERLDAASAPSERLEVHITYDEQDASIRHIRFDPIGDRWADFVLSSDGKGSV